MIDTLHILMGTSSVGIDLEYARTKSGSVAYQNVATAIKGDVHSQLSNLYTALVSKISALEVQSVQGNVAGRQTAAVGPFIF